MIAALALAAVLAADWPPLSPVLLVGGVYWCHATPAPSGFYSAAHCTRGGRSVAVAGTSRSPYSTDPKRDLAHFDTGTAHPWATMRDPEIGEQAGYRSDTGEGTYLVWGEGERGTWIYCHESGRRLRPGGSGTGLWARSDGALLGIFVEYETDDAGPVCGSAQAVWGVGVP